MYLCYIIEVTVSQTAVASTSKRHDNAPVCKIENKSKGLKPLLVDDHCRYILT